MLYKFKSVCYNQNYFYIDRKVSEFGAYRDASIRRWKI